MMFLKEGESAEGKRIRIAADQGPGKPLLRLQWRKQPGQGLPENEHFNTNYLLIVELGRIQSGKLPGKIHVSVPDAEKSSLSGTFVLEGLR
jgi:hypothetical protein